MQSALFVNTVFLLFFNFSFCRKLSLLYSEKLEMYEVLPRRKSCNKNKNYDSCGIPHTLGAKVPYQIAEYNSKYNSRNKGITAFFHQPCILLAIRVFFISIAIVIGPTPPGTGVI